MIQKKHKVIFYGVNPHLKEWITDGKEYLTDMFNPNAIQVCGDNNTAVIIPLSMVVSYKIEVLK